MAYPVTRRRVSLHPGGVLAAVGSLSLDGFSRVSAARSSCTGSRLVRLAPGDRASIASYGARSPSAGLLTVTGSLSLYGSLAQRRPRSCGSGISHLSARSPRSGGSHGLRLAPGRRWSLCYIGVAPRYRVRRLIRLAPTQRVFSNHSARSGASMSPSTSARSRFSGRSSAVGSLLYGGVSFGRDGSLLRCGFSRRVRLAPA